jgi:antitoxin (DNA-binding transcriptional repressor) of toxin-antitoxin stability system
MRTLSVDEAADHMDECVKAAADGDPVLVARDGRVVAAIVNVELLENLGILLPGGYGEQTDELEEALAAHLRAGRPPRYDGS